MATYEVMINKTLFASAYGEGSFSASTYNGESTTNPGTNPDTTTGTVTPGTPNTGFFQSAFSGANELSLIPILLGAAIVIGLGAVGVRKLLRKNK